MCSTIRNDPSSCGDRFGEVAVLVENLGELGHLLGQRLAGEASLGPFDAPIATAGEHPLDHRRILGLGLDEEVGHDLGVAPREQVVALLAQPVAVMRAAGAGAHLAMGHEAVAVQRSEVLPHGADGDAEGRGQLVGARLALALEGIEQGPAGGGQRVEGGGL